MKKVWLTFDDHHFYKKKIKPKRQSRILDAVCAKHCDQ